MVTLSFLQNADNEPPIVTCPIGPSVYVAIGVADAVVTWSPSPTASDIVEGVIDPATIVCEDSLGNVAVSGGRFLLGTTTVTCKVSDSVPNEGMCQFNVTVAGMCSLCGCIFSLSILFIPSSHLNNLSLLKT